MTRGRAALVVALVACAIAIVWVLLVGVPRWYGRAQSAGAITAGTPPGPGPLGRQIKAHLFYVAESGLGLTGVERDVHYADQPVDQAREIINAQIAPPPPPLVSAIPPGTTLRALFITPKGEAFVDLSAEITTAHPGGSLNELLTIYTIVHALTFNLPAITAVQLLVDGKEVDTLAGHVDLRRPLGKNLQITTGNEEGVKRQP